ncbi:hypothetical protein ISN45_Aa02g003070 [Arabidopsis thaliana x Arabidopsis arenosa]|uniref:Uncharacterized protein n=1 Tax=Arabidopsis thaliana x Arabidopsis arenosa TaxID=1240361 RepID=A0A8T2BII2_9BRAS|nr:hypothetical protein ISN45_Aa02g003070 [Arabidopsis thaliana x Arabidopsis arenosa]
MNATKFVVLLVIGVLCAIVTARQVEVVSKETKLATSLSITTTKGIGAQLSAYGRTDSNSYVSSYATATNGRKGPDADAYEGGYTSTKGEVYAKGHKARVSSASNSTAKGEAAAAATRKAAAARAKGSGEEVSKVTKLGTPLPKSTIKGVGAQLSSAAATDSITSGSSFASATKGPKGPRGDASEGAYTSTTGRVVAKGHKTRVSSTSGSSSTGASKAAANHKAASSSAGGSIGSGSRVKGSSEKKGKGKKKDLE